MRAGEILGPYRIVDKLGEGGMGQVYRARDTTLDRDVAIKILPETFAHDADRLARFQREAKTLASLNHPNIAIIHGFEQAGDVHALVMELVEGEDLSQRIARGAIPVDEALPIAKQIAEALEAAHEQGIIHRDLKPANIKVRPDGTVKVLDFGLAKAMEPASALSASAGQAQSQAPTITTPAMPFDWRSGHPEQGRGVTQAGMILGTAAYMSPEQARGKPVDKRADIWAFGVVLYEMLTGRRAFEDEDVSMTLSKVLQREPDFDALPAAVPSRVAQVLRLCLRKDPKQRLGDMQSVRVALEGAFDAALSQPSSTGRSPRGLALWQRAMSVAAAAVAGGLVVGGVAWWVWPARQEGSVTRVPILQAADQPLLPAVNHSTVALSRDGTRAAYVVTINNAPRLVLRSLDSLETRVIESESAIQPFFSPDGLWVGFFSQPLQRLYRVSVTGGPPSAIAAVGVSELRGATWGEDGTIVFGTLPPSGLWRVSANGGTPEPFTTPDGSLGELNHEWPEFLPGGEAVLFAVRRVGQADDASRIVMRDLQSETQHVLIEGGSYPKYASSGHLVYAIAGMIRAVPFDRTRRAVAGETVNVVQGVMSKLSGGAEFALAENGSLLYVSGDAQGIDNRSLAWVDPTGGEESIPTPANAFEALDLSPDGTRAALGTSGDADVWISDLTRGTLMRLTVDPAFDGSPLWSPDGERIAFASKRSGPFELLWQLADGSAAPDTLATFDASVTNVVPGTWSPDGTRLLAAVGSTVNQLDIGMVTVGKPESWQWLLQTPANERNPALSPDGRWLAFGSNQTGAYEVYVQRFPSGGSRQQVSVGGGHTPRWSADGRTLTYVRALVAGNPVAVTRVAVSGGTTEGTPLVFGPPLDLFSHQQYFSQPGGQWWFDMTPDGTRFLMIRGNVPGTDSQATLVFVHNWFTELERLVPAP